MVFSNMTLSLVGLTSLLALDIKFKVLSYFGLTFRADKNSQIEIFEHGQNSLQFKTQNNK